MFGSPRTLLSATFAAAALAVTSAAPVSAGTTTPNAGVAEAHTSAAGDGLPSCERIEYTGELGTMTVQVNTRTGTLQWGIYMHDPADDAGPWWVKVFVGGKKVDDKKPPRQMYPPHGSLPRSKAKSGKVFHIEARHVTTDGRESFNVTNGCVIP